MYGIALGPALWGPERLPLRRVRALLEGIPPRDSAIIRAVAPEFADWGTTQELLAGVAELIDTTNRYIHGAWGREPHPRPVVIRRPGQRAEPERKRPATADEMRRFFAGSVRIVP